MEKLAGKRQGNVLSSILTNWDVAEEALQTALNSDGSAVEENEKALDSITGKLTRLQVSYEDLSNTIVNDDLVKFIISGLTSVIDLTNRLDDVLNGNLLVAISAVIGGVGLLKSNFGIFTTYTDQYGAKHSKLWDKLTGTLSSNSTVPVNEYTLDISQTGLTSGYKGLTYKNMFGYTQKALDEIYGRIHKNVTALETFYTKAHDSIDNGGTFVDYLNQQLNDTTSELNKCDASAKLFAANEDNFKMMGRSVENYNQNIERTYGTTERNKVATQSWGDKLLGFLSQGLSDFAAAAISAGIYAIIALCVEGGMYASKAMEEARTAAGKLSKSLDSLDDYAAEIESLNAVLSNNSSATEDVVSAKERLNEITDELCEQYGLERNEIDLTNGKLEEQLQLLRDIRQEEYKKNSRENYEGNKKTIDAMSKQSIHLTNGDLWFHGINIDDLANTNPEMYYKTIEAFKNAGFTVEIEYLDSSGNALFGDGDTGDFTADDINTNLLNGDMKVNTIIDSVTADVYTLNNMLESLYDSIEDLNNEAAGSGYTDVTPVFDTMLSYFSEIFKNWLNNLLDGEDVLSQWIQYDDASPYAEYIPLLDAAKNKLNEAKKNKNISEIEAAQNEFNSLFNKIMSFEAGEGGKYTKLAQEWFNNTYGDALNYTSPLEEATEKFVKNIKPTMGFDSVVDKAMQIQQFLNNLDYDDLQIALQIDDLFDDGLDKAAEKIENFKQTNLTFEFKYADYYEDMNKTLEAAETIQTVLDSIASGEYNPDLDADTINELAAAFPNFSNEILAAQGDAEELEKVLKTILETTVQDMIDELPSLDGLSEENKAAVQGMLDMLETLKTGSITKLKEYANSLEYTQKLIERLKIADELRTILKSDSKSISQELLSSIQSAYPELNRYIQGYLANGSEKNAEALINAYLNAYSEDRTNFFNYIKGKDEDWTKSEWQTFLDDNTDWVDDFNKAYEINLRDYETYLEAMDALTEKHESDFDEYYRKAVGTGYIPTSVSEELRKRYDTENGTYPVDDFLLTTQEYREKSEESRLNELDSGDDSDADTTDLLAKAFEDDMRDIEHMYNMGLVSQEEYLNALEAANEKYYKDSADHLDNYLSNQEEIYKGRQSIYEDNVGSLIEDIDKQLEKGIITAAEYQSELAKIRETYYGGGSKYYGTEFASEHYDSINEKISDATDERYNEQLEKRRADNSYKENDTASRTAYNEYRRKLANRIYGNADAESYNPKKLKEELEEIDEETDSIWKDRTENEKKYWESLRDNSDSYYDTEIKRLEDIADEEERINKEEELRNKLIKARQQLLEAQNNRNQLIFSGGNFTYEIDQEAVQEAQESVQEAEDDIAEQQRQDQIDLLNEQKENASKYYQEIIDRIDEYLALLNGEETPTESDNDVMNAVNAAASDESAGAINDSVIASPAQAAMERHTDNELAAMISGTFSRDNRSILSIINKIPSDISDLTNIESISNRISQPNIETHNNYSSDNSVTVGDIHISVQGGTSIEMLKEFSEKIGGYIQQYTTQTNYAKK